MILLTVPIIFRRLFSFFMKRKSCCKEPAFARRKEKQNTIRTPEISATLWMGTSFLLCSPFPFLMALQVKEGAQISRDVIQLEAEADLQFD